jgi:SulP family sulfate permease
VRAGATSPIAGIVHAATLLVIVLAAAPLAASVPLAALAGILLFVAWNMGEWREFSRDHLRRFTLGYRVILLGTFGLTVMVDLMAAVEMGLVFTCLFFIWRMSLLFRTEPLDAQEAVAGVQVVRLHGALFFGAVGKIESMADALPPDTRALVLEMHRLIWVDASGIDALTQLWRKLQRRGIELWLCELEEEPMQRVRESGLQALVGDDRVVANLSTALLKLSTAAPR